MKGLPGRPPRACCPVHTGHGTEPVHGSLQRKWLSRPLAPWPVMPFTCTFLAPVSSCSGLCSEGFGQRLRGAPAEISFCREEERPWRHYPMVNQYPARSHSWSWPPSLAPGSIELPEPLIQGSHDNEMTSRRCQST